MRLLLVLALSAAISTLSVNGIKPIVKVMERGQHITITTVAQPLPPDLWFLMCNMPSLPPGENICKPHGSRDPNVDLDPAWAEICTSAANILGYAKGTCLAVESPIGSNSMYHVCALNANVTEDPLSDACAVYLTTEKLAVPIPRNQKCAKNGYKVLYERA